MGNTQIGHCHVLYFFSCLFPAPSEAPPSCEVKNRSTTGTFVSWKVMTRTFSAGVKTKYVLIYYILQHVWSAVCYCTGIGRFIIKQFLIAG